MLTTSYRALQTSRSGTPLNDPCQDFSMSCVYCRRVARLLHGRRGASAALLGLLFVSLSINIQTILKYPNLPGRAAATLGILLVVLVVCFFGLAPNEGRQTVRLGSSSPSALLSAGQTIWTSERRRRSGDRLTLDPRIPRATPPPRTGNPWWRRESPRPGRRWHLLDSRRHRARLRRGVRQCVGTPRRDPAITATYEHPPSEIRQCEISSAEFRKANSMNLEGNVSIYRTRSKCATCASSTRRFVALTKRRRSSFAPIRRHHRRVSRSSPTMSISDSTCCTITTRVKTRSSIPFCPAGSGPRGTNRTDRPRTPSGQGHDRRRANGLRQVAFRAGCRDTAEALAASFDQVNAALVPHLDNEEREVVPLAAVTVTQKEWDSLAKHGIAVYAREQEAHRLRNDPGTTEPDRPASTCSPILPPPVKVLYRLVGKRAWNKYATTLRIRYVTSTNSIVSPSYGLKATQNRSAVPVSAMNQALSRSLRKRGIDSRRVRVGGRRARRSRELHGADDDACALHLAGQANVHRGQRPRALARITRHHIRHAVTDRERKGVRGLVARRFGGSPDSSRPLLKPQDNSSGPSPRRIDCPRDPSGPCR